MSAEDKQTAAAPRRFVPLEDVQATLSISRSQAYALVRSGELRAIRVGGRGQWRVELTELDAYIERAYAEAARSVTAGDEADRPNRGGEGPMNDLVWYVLGYLDGKDSHGHRTSRCCCSLAAVVIMLLLASGVIFMASR